MALITINRAEKHNAISMATLDELNDAVDQAAAADPMAGMMMGMIAPMLDMAFAEVETMLKANSKTRTSWLCECFQPR